MKRANLRRKWSTIPKAAPIFVADAHRGDGKRFVVRSEEKLTAFLELERAHGNHRASKMPNDSAQSPPYDIAVTLDFEGIRKAHREFVIRLSERSG